MREIYFLFGIIIVILIPLAFLIRYSKDIYLPYKKRFSVMTDTEKQYFLKLQQTYGEQYYIFPQINLDKLVEITEKRNYYHYFNKINRKSVDFVLADRITLETVKIIELDDWTHKWRSRKQRDFKINKVLEKVNIPIEHVT